MAQLDRFFEVLVQRGAHELRLAAGEAPIFLFDEGPQAASKSQPTADQLLALLAEVVAPGEIAALRDRGVLDTELRRPGLPALRVSAKLAGEALTAVVRPASPAATRPMPAPLAVAEAEPEPAPAAAHPQPVDVPADPRAAIDLLLRTMVERKASDLHLSSCEAPILRIDGEIERIEGWPASEPARLAKMLESITPPALYAEFGTEHDADYAYEIAGLARFRANLFVDRKGPGAVFRVIPAKILTAQQLGLSGAILDLCRLSKGLVLVTGPTGSGKSTTLTAMIDHINSTRRDHVITIEDPIEFVHDARTCLINQREVGTHTGGFKRALRAALREDPDIVLVGEMRDLETIAIAIETAETGHLVFGTLHTTTAVSTVDRIIDQFPPEQQAQVRTMLSEALKGVIAQVLCKKIGGGRVAALEVLIGTPSVANLVREGKTFQIPSIMQTGRKFGMVTLNESLLDLVRRRQIEPEEAYLKAVDKVGIVAALKQAGADVSFLATEKPKEPVPA